MLTNDTVTVNGRTFYRIVALKDFGLIKAGTLGGYIESEDNLSHEGEAWVYENTYVGGNAKIHGNAYVFGNASVHGNTTCISNKAKVYEYIAIIGGIVFILCSNIWALCYWLRIV